MLQQLLRKPLYLLFATGTLLASSCTEKDEPETCMGSCTTVTGRLLTANGKQGLGQADVEVRWHTGQGSHWRATVKARTTTDATGNYRASFFIKDEEQSAKGYYMVHYTVNKSKYYVIGDDGQVLDGAQRNTQLILRDYVIPRKAHVRLAITNPGAVPAGAFQTTFSTYSGQINGLSSFVLGGGPVISWSNLPSENPMPVAGDQPLIVRSTRTVNSVTTRTTDTLFIAAGTVGSYTATY